MKDESWKILDFLAKKKQFDMDFEMYDEYDKTVIDYIVGEDCNDVNKEMKLKCKIKCPNFYNRWKNEQYKNELKQVAGSLY